MHGLNWTVGHGGYNNQGIVLLDFHIIASVSIATKTLRLSFVQENTILPTGVFSKQIMIVLFNLTLVILNDSAFKSCVAFKLFSSLTFDRLSGELATRR